MCLTFSTSAAASTLTMLVQASVQDLFIQQVPEHFIVMAGGSYGSLPIMLCTFTRLLLKLNGRDPGGLVFLVQLDAQAPTSGPEVFWVEKPLQVTADDFKRLYRHNFTCGSS